MWDEYLVDPEFTTAALSVNKARKEGTVMILDKPWETAAGTFVTILRDENKYRMYYQVWKDYPDGDSGLDVCYAESRDGINWEKPSLGIHEFEGSRDNNLLLTGICDNFYIMKDENHDCLPEHRYKAVMEGGFVKDNTSNQPSKKLVCLTSADGLHFEKHSVISTGYGYDSQNTLHWNPHTKKYYCYFREVRERGFDINPEWNEKKVRGIRVMESSDFVNWSEPVSLDFMGGEDCPMYTNCISAYPYDNRYYIGFPTRYTERKEWNKNYDRLCGGEWRRERYAMNKRYALAVTDCVFMSSRDNKSWRRFDEAALEIGPEVYTNWVYGDCYLAGGGVVETPSRFEGEPNELSVYVRGRKYDDPMAGVINRYSYRRDGFASYKAPYEKKILRTKLFTFEGDVLSMNFKTSARGSIYVSVLDERGEPIDGFSTCELFGDSLDREIDFERPLSELCGKAVSLCFVMSDAELFSFRFS